MKETQAAVTPEQSVPIGKLHLSRNQTPESVIGAIETQMTSTNLSTLVVEEEVIFATNLSTLVVEEVIFANFHICQNISPGRV